MESVGANEAKTKLPRLLDEVERGGVITITRHGREVARLVPAEASADADAGDLVAAIKAARNGLRGR